MFIEKIKTEGLAHLSYLIGADGQAAVIDPRRDCEVYVERAAARGSQITHIFETHRNEDLISGAPRLSQMTGAPVCHGPAPEAPVAYARTVREGEHFSLGSLRITVLETPGHTDDSLSFAVYDADFGQEAVAVFTGDALFVGDVGRTDFYPRRAEEVAGLLYDSLGKILALGDQAILYPAHGAGSVCGNNMAAREFSTLGYERLNNPMLRVENREDFVARKLAEHHYQPPYFALMERLNSDGAATPPASLPPPPLDIAESKRLMPSARLVDVRGIAAFLGAHLPGSFALPDSMISGFAGWFLRPDEDLLLVADDAAQAGAAARQLARIGFDRVVGYVKPALPVWAAGGEAFSALPVVGVAEVARRVADRPNGWALLDVRGRSEVETGIVAGAQTIYLGELPDHLDRLDRRRHYTVMCASGVRSTVAASLLRRAGFDQVDVFLGSMAAWRRAGQDIVQPRL